MFITRLGELAGITGWPFSETTTFGRFLSDVFFTVREPGLKLLRLKEIWDIAYEQDQWGVQSIMEAFYTATVFLKKSKQPSRFISLIPQIKFAKSLPRLNSENTQTGMVKKASELS